MKIIGFSIFKGGTGKSTSAVHTAYTLAQRGKRVLLIDLDQQASATRYLGLEPANTPNLYQVFIGALQPGTAIQPTAFGLDMLTSNVMMAAIEEAMELGKDEGKLAEILAPLRTRYDYILLDTPPGKAMLSFNALLASDLILIPAAAERMAIDGVADLINHVQNILWNKFNLEEQEIKILFTMYKSTNLHCPKIVNNAKRIWRENVLPIKIPESIAFPRSFDDRRPLNSYQPKHPGAVAYDLLADWLLHHETSQT